jgi:kumamolisin
MPERVPVPGSERPLPPGAELLDAAEGPAADAQLSVSVYLRSDPGTAAAFDPATEAERDLSTRRYLSAVEVEDQYGAAPDELRAVAEWLTSFGLTVTQTNRSARRLRVSGSAARFSEAFGVELRAASHAGTRFHTLTGPVQLPDDIATLIEAVFGLDDRPFGRSFIRQADGAFQTAIGAWSRAGGMGSNVPVPPGSFLPPQVATLYDFPSPSASGQTVAIFAFNDASTRGGYTAAVLDEYFTSDLKLTAPKITNVTVLGPGNQPGDGSNPDDASPEVYLDLSMVGSLAPGAKSIVYFTEFTEQGWVDALTEASTDATHDPSVISISYGNPEDGSGSAWTASAIRQVNQAFEAAAARGKTITAASGDSGASDGESSGVHVDFPASSPWVLACGGTRLAGAGMSVSSETVWNDLAQGNGATGGGVSTVFALPSWQTSAKVPDNVSSHKPGRGVPDVASLADPQTPYIVAQPGGTGGVGGTSAAAPLWAALIARLNALAPSTPVGYLNPKLYGLAENPLRDITVGSNKSADGPGYEAGPGWDACTGWGSPGAGSLASALHITGGTTPPANT